MVGNLLLLSQGKFSVSAFHNLYAQNKVSIRFKIFNPINNETSITGTFILLFEQSNDKLFSWNITGLLQFLIILMGNYGDKSTTDHVYFFNFSMAVVSKNNFKIIGKNVFK